MKTYYRVNVSFPNGHIEEIEDVFFTLEKAVEYGNSILNQVASTEAYHKDRTDMYGDKVSFKPYFEVIEVSDESSKSVYKSK